MNARRPEAAAPPPLEAEFLYDRLGSSDWEERERAAREARALPPGPLAALLAVPRGRQVRWRRHWWAAFFAWLALTVCALVGLAALYPAFMVAAPGVAFLFAFFASLWLPLLYFVYRSRAERVLIDAVAASMRPEVIGCAAQYVSVPDVRRAVTRRLPELRADHAGDWTPEQRAGLLFPLYELNKDVFVRNTTGLWDGRHAYALALLKALEQVGDGSERGRVEVLANLRAVTPADGALKRAAQDCLPFLEPRARERERAQTLLRASDASGAAPDTLLRAASADAATPPEQLLRPRNTPNLAP